MSRRKRGVQKQQGIIIAVAVVLILIIGVLFYYGRFSSSGQAVAAGKTGLSPVQIGNCIDYDGGLNSAVGSYILFKDGSNNFVADTCISPILLSESVCRPTKDGKGSYAAKSIDCSKLKKVCLTNSDSRAYCGLAENIPSATKNNAVQLLVAELDAAFLQTEQKFGTIKTLKKLDGNNEYPVDFVKERLFQQYLQYFLAGEYDQATIVHLRIMHGIKGCSQDCLRKLDWALATYYNHLLTKRDLKASQRAGIRGTINPALSIVEQLQYTGVSLIRRAIDGETTSENKVTGNPVLSQNVVATNPFLSAVNNWPAEVGLGCYNYETGTLDTITKRPALGVQGSNVKIRGTKYINPVQGMLTHLIDEKLQGRNDCSCMELAENDFVCPNDFICGGSNKLTDDVSQEPDLEQGAFYDPTTPEQDIPTMEDILSNICDTKNAMDSLGGMSPWQRSGVCGPTPEITGSVRGTTRGQLATCAKNFNQAQQTQIALSGQYGIVDPGCPLNEDGDRGPVSDTEQKDNSISICDVPIISIVCKIGEDDGEEQEPEERQTTNTGDLTRYCEGEEECSKLTTAVKSGRDRWDDQKLRDCIEQYCAEVSCSGEVNEAIDYRQETISEWIDAQGTDLYLSPDTEIVLLTDNGRNVFKSTAGHDLLAATTTSKTAKRNMRGEREIAIDRDALSSDRAGPIMAHEIAHQILDDLGIPPGNNGGAIHHEIMERCNVENRDSTSSGSEMPVDDVVGGGNDCSSSSRRMDDLTQCIAGEQPEPPDPLAPYVQPNPEDPDTITNAALQPTIDCLANQIARNTGGLIINKPTSSRPGPDCNFADFECCPTDARGRCLIQAGPMQGQPRPGCGNAETPVDPNQCSQEQCPEGQLPIIGDRGIECVDQIPSGCQTPPCEN